MASAWRKLAQHAADLDDDGHDTAGSGAPTTPDYLVGTAQGGLSAEIVVGATPGGELGGTWASPTVDATHSGSAHGDATATHIADSSDAHDASAISVTPAGGISSTDVQAALVELDGDISAGGIPATIFDAAGDLIVASAADTAVRLPMGSALQALRVNAGATALEYATPSAGLGAWTTWTPAWATTGTAPALGNGTLTGRYKQLDANTYWVTLRFQAGTTTTFGTGTWSFTGLPFTVAVAVDLPGHILDSGTDNKLCAGQIQASATSIVQITPEGGNQVNNTVPMTWATSDTLRMGGLVEV